MSHENIFNCSLEWDERTVATIFFFYAHHVECAITHRSAVEGSSLHGQYVTIVEFRRMAMFGGSRDLPVANSRLLICRSKDACTLHFLWSCDAVLLGETKSQCPTADSTPGQSLLHFMTTQTRPFWWPGRTAPRICNGSSCVCHAGKGNGRKSEWVVNHWSLTGLDKSLGKVGRGNHRRRRLPSKRNESRSNPFLFLTHFRSAD